MMQEAPVQSQAMLSAGQRLPELDGLRGVGMLLVLMAHCLVIPDYGVVAWIVRNTASIGWVGVDLFFALSGFLITGILLRSRTRPRYFRNFLVRRTLRILPLYGIVLALVLLVAPLLPFGPRGESWPYLTFVNNLWDPLHRLGVLAERASYWPLAHTWSLAMEVQFYLVIPLVVYLLDRRKLAAVLWAVIVVMPLARLSTNALTVPGASYFVTWCRLDPMAMGALMAVFLHPRSSMEAVLLRRARILWVALCAATVILWVTRQISFAKPLFNAVGVTIVDGALALTLFLVVVGGSRRLVSLVRWKPAVGLGRISYGVYLIHYPVFLLAQRYLPEGIPRNSWLWTFGLAAAAIGPSLVLAALSWRFLERPMLRLAKSLGSVAA